MGFFSSIFGSSRTKKLKEVSKKLNGMSGSSPEEIADNFFEHVQESNRGEDELFEIVIGDEDLSEIIDKHDMGKSELKDVYDALKRGGAGQMVNGHYVAGSALGFEESLNYLLSNYDKLCGEEVSRENVMSISHRMVTYFE